MTRPCGDLLGLDCWRALLAEWQLILERWADAMARDARDAGTGGLSGAERVDKTLSTSGAEAVADRGVPGGPELIAGADLAPPDMPADIPGGVAHERQPIGLRATRHIRRHLTQTTRRDLGRAMVDMCEPGGWRASTLNPDLPDARKFAILSARFDKIAQTDDPHVLYGALLALAGAAAGWAQGIARRQWRDAKRVQRANRRARRTTRRRAAGPAGHGDVDKGDDG